MLRQAQHDTNIFVILSLTKDQHDNFHGFRTVLGLNPEYDIQFNPVDALHPPDHKKNPAFRGKHTTVRPVN